MGYLHINNFYKDQTIKLFRECYALEKIHGTSAHISFTFVITGENPEGKWEPKFFSGGESYSKFVALFDQPHLLTAVDNLSIPRDRIITLYGEAYGGSQQGMSSTYGPNLKFIVFDVQIGDTWLSVPQAESIANNLGLEFVDYVKVSTDPLALDAERDKPSIQAKRNGILEDKPREGVVLRPLVEMTLNNGERVITKHKGDAFKETATPRKIVDQSQLQILSEANAVANEWVVNERLMHVLDKLPGHCMEKMRDIISAMVEDVYREAKGEIVESKAVQSAIGKKTVELYKGYLNSLIK